MLGISNWLFGFLIIMCCSFLGVGCQAIPTHSAADTLSGSWQYTHHSAYAGKTQVYPVYIDRDFSLGETALILQALGQWNTVFNGHAVFQVVDQHFDMQPDILKRAVEGRAFLVLRVQSVNRIVSTVDERHNILGVTPYIGSHWIYLVGSRLPFPPEFVSVTMHELGHALGAEHTPEGGLMNPYYDLSRDDQQCIDYRTVVQVAKYQGWQADTLNYCYWDIHAAPTQQP